MESFQQLTWLVDNDFDSVIIIKIHCHHTQRGHGSKGLAAGWQ